jgi:DNA polymerase V
MVDAGIFPGDVLVVDRSLTASHGDIVIVAVDGELTVKRLELKPKARLVAMNRSYAPIALGEDAELEIFGVATSVVHRLRNP